VRVGLCGHEPLRPVRSINRSSSITLPRCRNLASPIGTRYRHHLTGGRRGRGAHDRCTRSDRALELRRRTRRDERRASRDRRAPARFVRRSSSGRAAPSSASERVAGRRRVRSRAGLELAARFDTRAHLRWSRSRSKPPVSGGGSRSRTWVDDTCSARGWLVSPARARRIRHRRANGPTRKRPRDRVGNRYAARASSPVQRARSSRAARRPPRTHR